MDWTGLDLTGRSVGSYLLRTLVQLEHLAVLTKGDAAERNRLVLVIPL